MDVAIAAGVATFFGLVWWAFRSLGILPTIRMLLMLVVGCGASFAIGSILLRVYGWATDMTGGLPAWIGGSIVVIPAGLAAVALIYFVYYLHPKNKPDKRAEYFALSLPILVLFIGGTVGAATGSLRNNVGDTAGQIKASLVGNQGAAHHGSTHHHRSR